MIFLFNILDKLSISYSENPITNHFPFGLGVPDKVIILESFENPPYEADGSKY